MISRHQKRYIDETPWSLQTTFYPMGFVLQGAERAHRGRSISSPARCSTWPTPSASGKSAYRDWITVRAPNATEAQFFNLPQDGRVGVFEIFRTGIRPDRYANAAHG